MRAAHDTRNRTRWLYRLLIVTVVATMASPLPGSSAAGDTSPPPPPTVLAEDDVSAVIVDPPAGAVTTAGAPVAGLGDPLGLVPKAVFQRRYSLDTDVVEVWRCGPVSASHASIISRLEATVAPYYTAISAGEYSVSFTTGGDVPGPSGSCVSQVSAAATSAPEGVLVVDDWTSGGYASPGYVCSVGDCSWIPSTYPDNGRYAIIGESSLFSVDYVAVHEVGHTLHWPHSNAGIGNEYDNPIDVMSANSLNTSPYHSLAYNRYVSGWIDPGDVHVFDGTPVDLTLQPQHVAGTQMLVISTGTPGVFYTLGPRVQTAGDPIPLSWEGVEVYLVDQDTCAGWSGPTPCPSIWRDHVMEPAAPYATDHVLTVGSTVELASVPVSITSRSGDGFTVSVGVPGGGFLDTVGSVFEADIDWLAAEGITHGCNPPANTLFCPSDPVTREQMAAFLVRAMGYGDDGGGDLFVDDDGSIFEADIDKLATAGVTVGCNPPVNDRFCPSDVVTREQMAAFLHRALG